MTFPFYLNLGPLTFHPHLVFESLSYLIGYRLYLNLRKKTGDFISGGQRLWIVTAAIVGAVIGSKVLYWFSDPKMVIQNWKNPYYLIGGKTIVGGLIGGLFAVEWAKKHLHIVRSTGDLFAIPLAIGIAIGRIGCFLTGLDDHTYGNLTILPWGVNFGDGISRHPVQIYEMIWLFLIVGWLSWLGKQSYRNGDLFKSFMGFYMGFRFIVEFIKPGFLILGLTAIQWSAAFVLLYYWKDLLYILRFRKGIQNG